MSPRVHDITRSLRLPAAAMLAVVAVLAVAAVPAGATPAASQRVTSTCWLDVVNDWLDNGQVDRTYAIPCYTQAIQHLSSYPDIKNYSNAIDDIHQAQLEAQHREHNTATTGGGTGSGSAGGGGGGTGGSDGGGSNGSPVGHTGGGNRTPASSGSGKNSAPLPHFFRTNGPSNARSVPLPLIVLGSLGVLLLLTALGTWTLRRIQQNRRPQPAPVPAGVRTRR